MKKIIIALVVLYILISYNRWIKQVQSSDIGFKRDEEESRGKVTYEDTFLSSERKNFHNAKQEICQTTTKKYDTLVNTTNNYLQRYEHQISNVNEEITIDLKISIAGGDLIYLQKFSKNRNDTNYLRNFSKLDAIFSKIARKKESSFIEDALNSSNSFFIHFFSKINFIKYHNFLVFSIILLITWMVQQYFSYKCFLMFCGVLINSITIWEGLNLYWKKIKEAEIEIFLKKMQLKEMSECDPANMNWYQSFKSFFIGNKCLQYYKNLHKTAEDEVSLFDCIISMYSYYFAQTPMKILGASIRDLLGEISAFLPWPFAYFVNIPVFVFIICIIICLILVLCGKRLRLSFFGAALEIDDALRISQNKNSSTKKIKLLLKSKYPKRLELNVRRQRKVSLKASKSVPSAFDENALEFRNESTGDIEPQNP